MLTNSLLHRVALLSVLTLTTALAGCGASSDDFQAEDGATESSELTGPGIVPVVSIRGVKVGMTPTQVRAAAGAPKYAVKHPGTERVDFYGYGASTTTMEVTFDRDSQRVLYVTNFSATPRTKEGIGVGSTRSAVDALPNTNCFASRFDDGDGVEEYSGYIQKCEIVGTSAKTIFFFPTTSTISASPDAKVSIVTLAKR